jgi:hypothetical protein
MADRSVLIRMTIAPIAAFWRCSDVCVTSLDRIFDASLAPETCLEFSVFVNLIKDSVRQAKAIPLWRFVPEAVGRRNEPDAVPRKNKRREKAGVLDPVSKNRASDRNMGAMPKRERPRKWHAYWKALLGASPVARLLSQEPAWIGPTETAPSWRPWRCTVRLVLRSRTTGATGRHARRKADGPWSATNR